MTAKENIGYSDSKRMYNVEKLKIKLKQFNAEKESGKIDRGSIFVVVFLVCLITLGYLFVGGEIPTKIPYKKNMNYLMVNQIPAEPSRSTLQMNWLRGVTLTPVPTMPSGDPRVSQIPLTVSACDALALQGTAEQEMIWNVRAVKSPASGDNWSIQAFYADDRPVHLTDTAQTKSPADHKTNFRWQTTPRLDESKLPVTPVLCGITDVTDTTITPPAYTIPMCQATYIQPFEAYGTWKPERVTETTPPNGQNLGPGADLWPPNNIPSNSHDFTWTTELIWYMSDLYSFNLSQLTTAGTPLMANHKYRMQLVTHDGSDTPTHGSYCLEFIAPEGIPTQNNGYSTPAPHPLPL